jgi:hypothetical protein
MAAKFKALVAIRDGVKTIESRWRTTLAGKEKKCRGCGKKTFGRVDSIPLCSHCWAKEVAEALQTL